jgi:hypothetical protein
MKKYLVALLSQPMSDGGLLQIVRQAIADAGDAHMVDVVSVAEEPAGTAIPTDWPTWLAVKLDPTSFGNLKFEMRGPFWSRSAAEDWVAENADTPEVFAFVQAAAPEQQWRLR